MANVETTSESGIILDRRQLILGASAVGLASTFGVTPAMAQSAPKKGGTLRMGMEGGSPSDSLDPLTYADSIPITMSLMLWNNLVEVADNGDAVPELFESWEVKPGAADWTETCTPATSPSLNPPKPCRQSTLMPRTWRTPFVPAFRRSASRVSVPRMTRWTVFSVT